MVARFPTRWIGLLLLAATGCSSMPLGERFSAIMPGRSNKEAAIEMLAAGRDFEQRGEWERAHQHYVEMTKAHPKEVNGYHRAAAACDQLRRHAEAQAWYNKAIALDPEDSQLHNDLGYSYYLAGDLAAAETEIRAAIKLDELNPRYHNNLGLVLGAQDRPEQALEQFRLAGSEADAQFNLAFVHSLHHRFDDARNCFRQALAFDPNHAKSQAAIESFAKAEQNPEGWKESLYAASDETWVPYLEGMEKIDSTAANLPESIARRMTPGGASYNSGMSRSELGMPGSSSENSAPPVAR